MPCPGLTLKGLLLISILHPSVHSVLHLYAKNTVFNWPQGLISKDLQLWLEFHPKDYLFQFVFDQHESTIHVKLDGFQNGSWVRALRNMAARKLLVLLC